MQKDKFSKLFLNCCRLLAVGCVAAASHEKRAKNKAPNDYGRHVRATSSLGACAHEQCC